jgi:predicted Rossmann-fold nucleotide-binding protein
MLADINGFWTPLIELLHHMDQSAFIRSGFELSYGVAHDVSEVLPKIRKRLAQLARQPDSGGVPLEKM